MNEEGNDSHVLKPSKLDVNKFKGVKTNSPDQFGQQYNNDDDLSKWSETGPALSRKLHQRADTDLSARSLHHTLGIKHGQASPGDHSHHGITAKKIGPLEMDPVTLGATRAEWTIPAALTSAQIIALIQKFVNVRIV